MADYTSGPLSLAEDRNKTKDGEWKNKEGLQRESEELELSMSDDELLDLAKDWEKKWAQYSGKWKKRYEKNEKYWLGKHFSEAEMVNGATVDNQVFAAVETALPMATSKNPDPLVTSDNTPEGNALAKTVQGFLSFHADRLRLKKRLKKTVRHWFIYCQGCMKIGWSLKNNDLSCVSVHPTKLILDGDATIDEDMNYTGYYIGEFMEERADILVGRFPKCKKEIEEEAKDKMGSIIKYTEWWTDDYVFWKMKETILGKSVNPHWNEDYMGEITDAFGKVTQQEVKGRNHFRSKEKPYTFLSLLNLGKHPHDDTTYIEQVIGLQDVVNRRQKQIDKNVNDMNGGWIISMEKSGMTKEEASEVVEALRQGGSLVVPSGSAQEAAYRSMGTGLPKDVFDNLEDTRNEIKELFGVSGSNPAGIKGDKTVQGKNMVKAQDQERMATLVEAIEQFTDKVFNWWVQLMYVYYDEQHTASIMGEDKATEYLQLKNDQLDRRLSVTVKEGSMLPKDQATKANQSMILAKMGMMNPIDTLDAMDISDPRGVVKRNLIYAQDPMSLFAGDPDIQKLQQAKQEAQQATELKMAHAKDQEHQNELENITANHVVGAMVKGKPKDTSLQDQHQPTQQGQDENDNQSAPTN